jgi:hypothetical protein
MRTRVPISQRTRLGDLGEQKNRRSEMRIEVLRVRGTGKY